MEEYLLYYNEYSLKYGKNNIVILMQVGSFFEIYAYRENLKYLDKVADALGIRRTRKKGGNTDSDNESDDDSDNDLDLDSDLDLDFKLEAPDVEKQVKSIPIKKGSKTNNEKPPRRTIYMAGFLCLKIDTFLHKLLDRNYTVIEIRQVQNKLRLKTEDVTRQVTKIYTPGTYLANSTIKESNYLMYLYIEEEYVRAYGSIITCCGISVVDFSTGELIVYEVLSPQHDVNYALDESLRFINSYVPKEIIICHISPQIINRKYYEDFDLVEKLISNKALNKDTLITYFELENKNYKYYKTINEGFKQYKYANTYLSKIYKLTVPRNDIISYFNLERKPYALISLLGLIDYVLQRDRQIIDKLHNPTIFKSKRHLLLGNNAVTQLNVIGTSQNTTSCLDTKKITSLFDVVNHTRTPMGQRYLYSLLINPIINIDELKESYNRIDECRQGKFYWNLGEMLKKIIDLERYWRKLTLLRIDPYEFFNFYKSVLIVPRIIKSIKESKKQSIMAILPKQETITLIEKFIEEFKDDFDTSTMKHASLVNLEKSIFNANYCVKNNCVKINELQNQIDLETGLMDDICRELSKYLVVPSKKTSVKKRPTTTNNEDNVSGIQQLSKSITMKYNSKEGHYLALSKNKSNLLKTNLEGVTEIKINNQFTITTAKLRFQDTPNNKNTKIFFEELKNKSNDVEQLKSELIDMLLEQITACYTRYAEKYDDVFREAIRFIVQIDTLQSSAKISVINNYCKPVIHENDSGFIRAKALRHPIIERIRTEVEYIPHDIALGQRSNNNECNSELNTIDDNKLNGMLIYGLNSSGKSSLMKAIGLSIVMAQCGFYVPAQGFEFSPYDSLFARITGNDNIFKGQSSFTLEMTELDTILGRTGPKTLVIGDEVCRGTEHISGSAIVAATIIELAKTKSSFIFASHLHDISTMEEITSLPNVKSFHLTVEHDDVKDILIYDRKLKEGFGDTVYGFTVAKYIIKNKEFMERVVSIKNKITNQGINTSDKSLITGRKSNYNSSIYMVCCGICGKEDIDLEHASYLDTHHINFQKDCKDGFVINKPHLPMNSAANLIVLCKLCHHNVHHGKLEIKGYIDTLEGRKLDYKIIDENVISNDDSCSNCVNCEDHNKDNNNNKIELLPKKSKNNLLKAQSIQQKKQNLVKKKRINNVMAKQS